MERAVAIKKLGKILGKSLGYRIDPKAPFQEQRDAARAELPDVNARKKTLNEQMIARSREILDADSEYRLLKANYNNLREYSEKLSSITMHYKITVGTSNGMFFTVRAQGDTWEQVIGKLAEKERLS